MKIKKLLNMPLKIKNAKEEVVAVEDEKTNNSLAEEIQKHLLLTSRKVLINEYIDETSVIKAWLYIEYLRDVDKDKPIYLYINSSGGSVHDALFLMDYLRSCETPIYTIGMGQCESSAFNILCCGHHRSCYENTLLMIHNVHVQFEEAIEFTAGQSKNYVLQLNEVESTCVRVLSQQSKLTEKEITENINKYNEWYLGPTEALKSGFIDEIIKPIKIKRKRSYKRNVK